VDGNEEEEDDADDEHEEVEAEADSPLLTSIELEYSRSCFWQ
jgi:hypothetical protein